MFQNLKLQFNVLKSFNFNFQMYKFEMCYRAMWRRECLRLCLKIMQEIGIEEKTSIPGNDASIHDDFAYIHDDS